MDKKIISKKIEKGIEKRKIIVYNVKRRKKKGRKDSANENYVK